MSKQAEFWASECAAVAAGSVRTPPEIDAHWFKFVDYPRTVVDRMLFCGLPLDAKILEVGCGAGNHLEHLRTLGYQNLYGVDINPQAVAAAREARPHLHIKQANARELPFKANTFDVVWTNCCLIHVPPIDLSAVLAEMRRVSRTYIAGYEYYERAHQALPSNLSADGSEVQDMSWAGPFGSLICNGGEFRPTRIWRCERKHPVGRFDEAYLLRKSLVIA